MDENEIKDIVKFWYILGFIQAKITESSDLFEKNWDRFADVFTEKNEAATSEETVPEETKEVEE